MLRDAAKSQQVVVLAQKKNDRALKNNTPKSKLVDQDRAAE